MTNAAERSGLATAEIIAVGSELLTPFRTDTNSLFLTARLNEVGIVVRRKSIVGDSATDVAAAVREALARVDLLVVCGGLGPTDDDLTRETVAEVLGRPLREDAGILEWLVGRFAARGWVMPENNRRQARVPEGAIVLDNPRGTAPGLWIEDDGRVVVLLPGPPRELEPMFAELASGRLAERSPVERIHRRVLRVAGLGESHVEAVTQPVYARWRGEDPAVETTILASPGSVQLHLSTRVDTQTGATDVLDRATAELAAVLGEHLVSTDGRSLSEVAGGLLQRHGYRVAVGESCTGGLVSAALVDTPGSSDYLVQSIVAYSNDAKRSALGVEAAVLEQHGAVSEPVAEAMAEGARRAAGVEVGIGVTGIAGPGGGSPDKPVGTVCFAVLAPDGRRIVKTVQLPGDRTMVRQMATRTALDLLRRVLGRPAGDAAARRD
ncbi:MAG: competence/damage-inducible protein A [Acidobacteria bacterium]|nr:competence/damage-inducible protein A [Acidobacteriota bacterium]